MTCNRISRRSSLPSRSSAWRWLVKKEWRELMSSRSWWVMLALIGPLVGVSFISAVRSYAEASGQGGPGAGLADALFPLDGVVAPTFSAYEIAASFLLPFVAIRAIAGDRASGALKLALQRGMMPLSMIGAKALVLGAGWLLAGVPIALAGILWASDGGICSDRRIAGSCRNLDARGRIGAATGDRVGRHSLRGRGSRLRVLLCKTELGRLGKRAEFLW